ncbi:unnamed protein product [Rotaria magnacalcarata]|uniref:CCHC-type domain-containing protein n=5 Tax=Rotaria magnacalcarata TaxID=392030 RepID=A0A814IFR7_9BILA|nr:unnamed protein product [Rotaria magnacalcarata]CAF4703975.1 unnamed protein product [Rotaria magnacalcarata]
MSQKMMISWLENGVKDVLKIQIKRQMKSLSESARTTHAFLKISKDEQELQEENVPKPYTTSPYVPYFTNTVSTTLKQTDNMHSNSLNHSYPSQATTSHESNNLYRQQKEHLNIRQRSPSRIRYTPSQQRSFNFKSPSLTSRRHMQHIPSENATSIKPSTIRTRQYDPCSICRRKNHRTIDCHHRKTFGCFKCRQPDHRIRDCPQVFD